MTNFERVIKYLEQQGLTKDDVSYCIEKYHKYGFGNLELFKLDRKVDYRDFVNELIQDKLGDNEIISDYLADPHVADGFVKFYINRWTDNMVYNDETRSVIIFKNCV